MSQVQSLAETVAFGRRAARVEDPPARGGHAALAAVLVLAGGMAAGSAAFLVSRERPAPAGPLAITVGEARLVVPSPLLRGRAQAGTAARVDLALSWPGLGPAEARISPTKDHPSGLGDVVLVTVSAPAEGPSPEQRAAEVYARFVEPDVSARPDGLLARRFRAGSPYAGEDLYLAAPDGRRFAARCDAPGHFADGLPSLCMAEMRRGGLDLRIRFEPGLLPQWEALEQRIPALLATMAR